MSDGQIRTILVTEAASIPSSSTSSSASLSHNHHVGAIVGAVVSAIVGLALLTVAVLFFLRRRKPINEPYKMHTGSDDVAVAEEKWIVIGSTHELVNPQEVDGQGVQVPGMVAGKAELEDTSLRLQIRNIVNK